MHVLFVHRAFPGQFRYVAPRLAMRGWECTFVTRDDSGPKLPGVRRIGYSPCTAPPPTFQPYARPVEAALAHAAGVYQALKALPEVRPDLIVAHGSFGSSLFLPHLYDAPVINFFEYFHRAVGQALGYRSEDPVTELDLLRCDVDNAMTLLDLANCDRAWAPTLYQRDLMPAEFRPKVEVVHDGIDTQAFRRRPDAPRRLPDGTEVPADTRVITYVTRGMEMLRGFDLFMRAAKMIYERFPRVVFAVAGSDRVWYGSGRQCGAHGSLRERVLESGNFDASRIRFLGVVPQRELADLLSISDLHIYLTAPYFTSWSVLEAMSCSCVVLASDQPCTREYLRHGENGLLCDFFDVEGMVRQAVDVLNEPGAWRHLGEAARRTIEQTFSVDVTLPRVEAMFRDVAAAAPRSPSVRRDLLVRPGRAVLHARSERGAGAPRVQLPPYEGTVPFYASAGGQAAVLPCARRQAAEDGGPGSGLELSSFAFVGPTGPFASARGPRRGVVLFAWELGAGLGHLKQMLPLVEAMTAAGHRVFVALREFDHAAEVLGRAGVSFLQAPAWTGPGQGVGTSPPPITYTQMLLQVGFGDDGELFTRASAWRTMFGLVRPDLILCDHSPTALLASIGLSFAPRRALIGSGFCCPPDNAAAAGAAGTAPWGVIRPQLASMVDGKRLLQDEARTLDRINRVLAGWRQPPLKRLGQLYGDVNENFLTTFPELDHFDYHQRSATAYWGPVIGGADGGKPPQWPTVRGKRTFVYLKGGPAACETLEALGATGQPVVAFVDSLSPSARRQYGTQTLHIEDRPLDMRRVAAECEVAVLSGGHGATAEILLAGKPVVEVPSALEQCLTAEAVERLGAGVRAAPDEPTSVGAALEQVLANDHFRQAAEAFAHRYAAFDPAAQRRAMTRRVTELLAQGSDVPTMRYKMSYSDSHEVDAQALSFGSTFLTT